MSGIDTSSLVENDSLVEAVEDHEDEYFAQEAIEYHENEDNASFQTCPEIESQQHLCSRGSTGRVWYNPWSSMKLSALKFKLCGCILAITGGICYSVSDFVLEQFELNYVEVFIMASLMQMILSGLYIIAFNGCKFWPSTASVKAKVFLFLCSCFSSLKMACIYSSIILMPLGDAVTIFYTIPFFAMTFSLVFLRIPIKLWKVSSGLLLLMGAILVVKPPLLFPPIDVIDSKDNKEVDVDADYLYCFGILMALGVALFGGLSNVSVAMCASQIHTSVILFYTGLIWIPVGIVASSFDPCQRFISHEFANISVEDWGELMLQSLLLVTGILFVVLSIKLTDPILPSVLAPAMHIILGYAIMASTLASGLSYIALGGILLALTSSVLLTFEHQLVPKMPEGCREYW